MRITSLILIILTLSACASAPLEGTGEVHHLTVNRVIYRDLTQPVSLHNPQQVRRITKDPKYVDRTEAQQHK